LVALTLTEQESDDRLLRAAGLLAALFFVCRSALPPCRNQRFSGAGLLGIPSTSVIW